MVRGFTLIEILLSLAIVGVIAAFGVASWSGWNAREALRSESATLVALLAQARAETLSAKGGFAYGVHVEERKAVLFQGPAYSASDTANRAHPLHADVRISATALAGGGAEVLFRKLTGATAESGTVTLSLARDASASTTITIAATGVAY